MRVLLVLLIGIAIGVAAVLYYNSQGHHPQLQAAGDRLENAAKSARDTIADKLHSLHLRSGDITNELARTGRVIRDKAAAAGKAISDATADARITGAIKAKLVRDSDLSAWDISVNTTDGVVTLSGTATSADNIGKAMLLAMETDGVRQVISTLQVKPK